MHYVVGFLIREDDSVLLIRKNKPPHLNGYWNGLGGGVERGEKTVDAVVREFLEEAAITSNRDDWGLIATMNSHYEDRLDFFVAKWRSDMGIGKTTTSEPINWFRIGNIEDRNVYPNLLWLIPLARNYLKDNDKTRLYIIED